MFATTFRKEAPETRITIEHGHWHVRRHPPMISLTKIRSLLLLAALLSCEVGCLRADLVINLGDIEIPQGAITYTVDVMITGGDAITDMVAYLQIGDGGPRFGGTAGPKITSIDLSGSIWSTAAGGFIRNDSLAYPTQFQELSISLNSAGQTVAGNDGDLTWTDDGTLTGSLPSTALKRFYRVIVE